MDEYQTWMNQQGFMNRTPLSDIPGRPFAPQAGFGKQDAAGQSQLPPPLPPQGMPGPMMGDPGVAGSIGGAPSVPFLPPQITDVENAGLYGRYVDTWNAGRQMAQPEQPPMDPQDAWMMEHLPRAYAQQQMFTRMRSMRDAQANAAAMQPQIDAQMAEQKAQTELSLMQQKGAMDLDLTRQKSQAQSEATQQKQQADAAAMQQKSAMADAQMQQKMRHQQMQQLMAERSPQAPPPAGGGPMRQY